MLESSTLLRSLGDTAAGVAEVLPDIVIATLLLILGWFAARMARRMAVRGLRMAQVDRLAERSGVDDFLVRGGVEVTLVTIIGGAVYWLILGGVFVALLDAIGLPTGRLLLARLSAFIPNLVLAIGILVFGSLLSRVIGGLVFSYLSNIGSAAAEAVGAVARYAVLVFVLFMAAEQLAIQTAVLVSAFQIAFAAVCLAAALAFGLGGRDWAAQVISRYTRK
jgi:hypothetical protein